MNENESTATLEARVSALEQTLVAMTMLAMRQMPFGQRQQFAEGVAVLARTAKSNDSASGELLTQLRSAAAMAALK